jgi:hypothetical protein
MARETHDIALKRLDAFIGTWRMEATFPRAVTAEVAGPDDDAASATFAWTLDRKFVVQRSNAPRPAPDSLAIISFDPERKVYTQHYFDSRGVVRVYAMTFDDRVWTLLRDSPDFSPLAFSQRYIGTFSADGDSILGRWETSKDGENWEHDFELNYSKIG